MKYALRALLVWCGLRACTHPEHPHDHCPLWERDYA